ncbi:hypothetical protein NC653_020040 [Populus alba x Populus x berolinensis]|uniref:Uncharacterized protein n=1 Tax=Populus alba x Populus x berolinensis TaxID=444605 RepID=A0AAD6QDC2_9ROSI|nr:hypothetical protein NC653_020040 [Populus alba x Populus x berolinensis]
MTIRGKRKTKRRQTLKESTSKEIKSIPGYYNIKITNIIISKTLPLKCSLHIPPPLIIQRERERESFRVSIVLLLLRYAASISEFARISPIPNPNPRVSVSQLDLSSLLLQKISENELVGVDENLSAVVAVIDFMIFSNCEHVITEKICKPCEGTCKMSTFCSHGTCITVGSALCAKDLHKLKHGCNCSDSGSGWRGTHPSRTAILPTFRRISALLVALHWMSRVVAVIMMAADVLSRYPLVVVASYPFQMELALLAHILPLCRAGSVSGMKYSCCSKDSSSELGFRATNWQQTCNHSSC